MNSNYNLFKDVSLTDQQDILFYAFRYALGRKTYCTHTVTNAIITCWDGLSDRDKQGYREEIARAIKEGNAGHAQDENNWCKILRLPV